jgi:hypothetical protein
MLEHNIFFTTGGYNLSHEEHELSFSLSENAQYAYEDLLIPIGYH